MRPEDWPSATMIAGMCLAAICVGFFLMPLLWLARHDIDLAEHR